MLKNLIFNIGSKALIIVCQLLALIITNHVIGPEGRGILLAAITWGNTFFILFHGSFSTGILNLTNKKADNIFDAAYFSAIAAFVLGIFSILVAFTCYAIYPGLFNNLNTKYLSLVLAVIPFMMLQQYSMAIVQAKGNFKAFNLLYAIFGLTNLCSIVVVWLMHKISVDLLIYINLFAWVVTGLLGFYFMWPFIKHKKPGNHLLRLLIKTSLLAHFSSIVTFVVNRSDILIVNYFSPEKQTGIYGLACAIVQMLLIIPLSVQNILFHALMGKPREEQKRILLQHSRITFAIMLVCATGVMLLSRPLVYVIGGKSFAEAIPLFKYFLPAIIFYSMPMVLATQWYIMGIFRQINLTSIIVLVISLLCNIILVPLIGITGGAITFLTISIVSFCIHILFVKRYLGNTPLSEILLIKSSDVKNIINRKKNVF